MTPRCGISDLLPEAVLRERGRKRVLVGDAGVTISDHSQKADHESKSFLQEIWHIQDKGISEEVDCVCDIKLRIEMRVRLYS
jgi:hypothetical protein